MAFFLYQINKQQNWRNFKHRGHYALTLLSLQSLNINLIQSSMLSCMLLSKKHERFITDFQINLFQSLGETFLKNFVKNAFLLFWSKFWFRPNSTYREMVLRTIKSICITFYGLKHISMILKQTRLDYYHQTWTQNYQEKNIITLK